MHGVLAAREAGYETIMINCNPETVSTDFDISEQIICYKGDITKYNDVKQIYKNHNITGTIINLKDVSSEKKLLKGTKNIIKSIKKCNSSKKVAITSAIGCGQSINKIPFYLKFLIKTVLKKQYNDNIVEIVIRIHVV